MRVAIDTNLLVYVEGVNGEERKQRAHMALSSLGSDDVVVPAQALAELFTVLTRKARWPAAKARAAVLTRKARWPAAKARAAVLTWHDACLVAETTSSVLLEAMDLSAMHQYSLWDAIMLAGAAQAGCRMLLSEDMQDGFVWRGVEIRNPFRESAVGQAT